jgi:hypothetical protein
VGAATPGGHGPTTTKQAGMQVNIRATCHHSISGQYSMPIDMRFSGQINCPQNAMKVQATGDRWLYFPTLR